MAFSKTTALHFLKKALDEDRLGHAYLISTGANEGSQILAEEIASLVLGTSGPLHVLEHPDFHSVSPESKSRKIVIEQIRQLEEKLHLKSQISSYKVAVIHDADRMISAAANAFLKTLEEPPDRTLLLLLTSLPEALLQTIRSRCIPLAIYSAEEPPRQAREEKVLQLMQHFFSPQAPKDATAAFQLTRAFQALLTEAREEALEAAKEEAAAEKEHYQKTTEQTGAAQREEAGKAALEATILKHRTLLLGAISDYFGTRLRVVTITCKEQDNHQKEIAHLLRSLDIIEVLRNTLEQGVQEALALEAGFLELMSLYSRLN